MRPGNVTHPVPVSKQQQQQQTNKQTNINTVLFIVHGAWSDWSEWETCSQDCGEGTQGRVRTCDNPAPQHGGDPCPGHDRETQDCKIVECPSE